MITKKFVDSITICRRGAGFFPEFHFSCSLKSNGFYYYFEKVLLSGELTVKVDDFNHRIREDYIVDLGSKKEFIVAVYAYVNA